MNDYTNARYWAISSIGYGKGFTPEEAVDNYVATQLSNHRAADTIYKTKPKWEAALRSGDAKPIVWLAPEGATGFYLDSYVNWRFDDDRRPVRAVLADRVFQYVAAGDVITKAIDDVFEEIGATSDKDVDRANLLVNVILTRLAVPDITVREAVAECWSEDVDAVLGWSA